jgi:hypothetical protein
MICWTTVATFITSLLDKLGGCTDRPIFWVSCFGRCCHHYLAMAVVSLLISQLLPRNRSMCHVMNPYWSKYSIKVSVYLSVCLSVCTINVWMLEVTREPRRVWIPPRPKGALYLFQEEGECSATSQRRVQPICLKCFFNTKWACSC